MSQSSDKADMIGGSVTILEFLTFIKYLEKYHYIEAYNIIFLFKNNASKLIYFYHS